MTSSNKQSSVLLPPASRWGIFLISFGVLFIVASLCYAIINYLSVSQYSKLLTGSALQGIIAFVLPTYITFKLTSKSSFSIIGLNKSLSWKNVTGVICLYILMIPFMNQIIYYNENFSFPEAWKTIEQQLRAWEEMGTNSTNQLLSVTSWGGLIMNIMIIGILTGFAEEMFFRGGVQKLLILSHVNNHLAIWIAAIIFSTVHFQFFGFIPRVILGAMFGYVYYWTKSIWAPTMMHALNNSIIVVFSWLNTNNIINFNFDVFSITESGMPWWAIISILTSVLFILIFRKYMFKP